MSKLIHVATLGKSYLFLRQLETGEYQWFDEKGRALDLIAPTIEEALRLGFKKWKAEGFKSLPCGYRFTLPERDEHGQPALYHQMVKSLGSMNGVYFDEGAGHNCIVHQVPLSTRRLIEQFLV